MNILAIISYYLNYTYIKYERKYEVRSMRSSSDFRGPIKIKAGDLKKIIDASQNKSGLFMKGKLSPTLKGISDLYNILPDKSPEADLSTAELLSVCDLLTKRKIKPKDQILTAELANKIGSGLLDDVKILQKYNRCNPAYFHLVLLTKFDSVMLHEHLTKSVNERTYLIELMYDYNVLSPAIAKCFLCNNRDRIKTKELYDDLSDLHQRRLLNIETLPFALVDIIDNDIGDIILKENQNSTLMWNEAVTACRGYYNERIPRIGSWIWKQNSDVMRLLNKCLHIGILSHDLIKFLDLNPKFLIHLNHFVSVAGKHPYFEELQDELDRARIIIILKNHYLYPKVSDLHNIPVEDYYGDYLHSSDQRRDKYYMRIIMFVTGDRELINACKPLIESSKDSDLFLFCMFRLHYHGLLTIPNLCLISKDHHRERTELLILLAQHELLTDDMLFLISTHPQPGVLLRNLEPSKINADYLSQELVKMDKREIASKSWLIYQIVRQKGYYAIPREIMSKIAAYVSDKHSHEEAYKIAYSRLGNRKMIRWKNVNTNENPESNTSDDDKTSTRHSRKESKK